MESGYVRDFLRDTYGTNIRIETIVKRDAMLGNARNGASSLVSKANSLGMFIFLSCMTLMNHAVIVCA